MKYFSFIHKPEKYSIKQKNGQIMKEGYFIIFFLRSTLVTCCLVLGFFMAYRASVENQFKVTGVLNFKRRWRWPAKYCIAPSNAVPEKKWPMAQTLIRVWQLNYTIQRHRWKCKVYRMPSFLSVARRKVFGTKRGQRILVEVSLLNTSFFVVTKITLSAKIPTRKCVVYVYITFSM